jgi:protein-arginine kinase activator protein McsA
MKKLTNEAFFKGIEKEHGDKYDYSKLEYINMSTKVTIICPIHGEFKQRPHNHVEGKGCPKCGFDRTRNSKVKTTNKFIAQANEIHNNKYDYSKTNYTTGIIKVIIICPIHGEFKQDPYNHLQGKGCPKCGKVYKPTTEEFIQKVRGVHGDKYDYSLFKYVTSSTASEIICPIHGKFKQTPQNHLKGKGCFKCGKAYASR